MDDLAVEVGDLGDGACRSRAHDDPYTLADPRLVLCLVDETPWQPGVVLGVEVEHEVDCRVTHEVSSRKFPGSW